MLLHSPRSELNIYKTQNILADNRMKVSEHVILNNKLRFQKLELAKIIHSKINYNNSNLGT